MKKHTFYIALCSLVFFTACKEDPEPEPEPAKTSYVLIANKGVVPSGMGSVSQYFPQSQTRENFVFQKANQKLAGTSINSLLIDGNRTFVVVSGDATIYVVNSSTFDVQDKILGFDNPRYIVKVAEDKYYVSDWGLDGIYVLNMRSKKISKELETGVGPDQMLVYKKKVFILNNGGNVSGTVGIDSTISVYDAEMDTLMATITVGENPNSLQLDADNHLWVMSPGIRDVFDPNNSTLGKMSVVDPDSLEVIHEFDFPTNIMKPRYLQINKEKNTFFYLDEQEGANIFKFTIADSVLPSFPFITGNFNCLGYDPIENELYAANPFDLQIPTEIEPGEVFRYDIDGALIDRFKVDKHPINFNFK